MCVIYISVHTNIQIHLYTFIYTHHTHSIFSVKRDLLIFKETSRRDQQNTSHNSFAFERNLSICKETYTYEKRPHKETYVYAHQPHKETYNISPENPLLHKRDLRIYTDTYTCWRETSPKDFKKRPITNLLQLFPALQRRPMHTKIHLTK